MKYSGSYPLYSQSSLFNEKKKAWNSHPLIIIATSLLYSYKFWDLGLTMPLLRFAFPHCELKELNWKLSMIFSVWTHVLSQISYSHWLPLAAWLLDHAMAPGSTSHWDSPHPLPWPSPHNQTDYLHSLSSVFFFLDWRKCYYVLEWVIWHFEQPQKTPEDNSEAE